MSAPAHSATKGSGKPTPAIQYKNKFTSITNAPSSGPHTDWKGHRYNGPVAREDARQVNGNLGPQGEKPSFNEYNQPEAKGKAIQINGNVSNEATDDFLKKLFGC